MESLDKAVDVRGWLRFERGEAGELEAARGSSQPNRDREDPNVVGFVDVSGLIEGWRVICWKV
jgi:hypothetical protein